MARKDNVEPLLYISSQFTAIDVEDPLEFCRLSPDVSEDEVIDDIKSHISKEVQYYNLITAILSGQRHAVSLFSPEAEKPLNQEIIDKYKVLPTLADTITF